VFNLATKDIKQYVFSVCVSCLNCPVKNNHVTCYIAVTGLPVGTKLYTFSYHVYLFQNNVTLHKLWAGALSWWSNHVLFCH
jgi:hypothetical protein